MITNSKLSFAGIAIAITVALAGPVAAAAPGAPANGGMENFAPHRPANQAMTRNGQFILNADSDVELVRFSTPHDMLVCLPPKEDVSGRPDLAGDVQYPVILNWDDNTGELWPGNCLGFDAAKASISPSPAMPKGDHVVGRIVLF